MVSKIINIKELIKKKILSDSPAQKYKNELEKGDNIFKYITQNGFSKIINKSPSKIKRIGIVLPHMNVGSGGITSVLRIGTYLSKKYEVVFTTYSQVPIEVFKKNAHKNLKEYQGSNIDWDEFRSKKFDVIIATNWQSVYFTRNLPGYKIYFVQDFEPYFYARGDFYFLALQTYKMGYHIISLGEWNAQQIKKECNIKNIDYITFPYEPTEYTLKVRDYLAYKDKTNFDIAVYLKDNSKRLPLITQSALINIKDLFKKRNNIELNFHIFGYSKEIPLVIGENEGILNKKEINQLYHRCDFGIVSSVTNISLVPFEMIATGLPLIEFENGTYSSFFPKDTAILTNFESENLYRQLLNYIQSPTLLSKMTHKAYIHIQNRNWSKTGQQFLSIIDNI